MSIALLDQQPLFWPSPARCARSHPNERESAEELFTLKHNVDLTAGKLRLERECVARPVAAPIPDHDCSGAILAFWNDAFKVRILERMVLCPDGEALFRGVHGRTLWHGPGYENATDFEPEVVVQVARSVLLDNKDLLVAA
jgi:hypothetical protein